MGAESHWTDDEDHENAFYSGCNGALVLGGAGLFGAGASITK